MFLTDFFYWKESHFNALPKKIVFQLRDLLLSHGCAIQKERGFHMNRALSLYIEQETQRVGTASAFPPSQPPNPSPFSLAIIADPLESQGATNIVQSACPTSAPLLQNQSGPVERSDSHQQRRSNPKPSDVPKLFSRDMRYSGDPRQPLRTLYASFKDACELSGISDDDHAIVMKLIQNFSLKDSALKYFISHIKNTATNPENALQILESQVLGHRAKRVNNEVWNDLSSDFVKQSRSFKKLSSTNDDILSDLINQISDMSDMRTSPGSDEIIMGKLISSVRSNAIFSVVCQNPPDKIEELKSVLRSCALEADRAGHPWWRF